ncbi:MAG: hypothetical protein R3B72_07585 [Polyangiaceae bacterium]
MTHRPLALVGVTTFLLACGTEYRPLPTLDVPDTPVEAPASPAPPDDDVTGTFGKVPGTESDDLCAAASCGGQSCDAGICNALSWGAALAGDYDGTVEDLAVAPDGDMILVGAFFGSVETKEGMVESVDGPDGYVAKVGPAGELRWFRPLGGEGSSRVRSVAVDADGTIAVGGELAGEIALGDVTLVTSGREDAFVALLASEGSPRWARVFGEPLDAAGNPGPPEHQHVAAVAFRPDGEGLVAAGGFHAAIDISGDVYTASGDEDGFLVSLDMSGDLLWSQAFGGPGQDHVAALAVDGSGELWLAGHFSQDLQLGDLSAGAAGGRDVFVARVASDGEPRYLAAFGDEADEAATGLALDGEAVVVTGWFEQTLPLAGEQTLASASGADVFVARLLHEEVVQARAMGGELDQRPHDVAIDAAGRTTVVGSFAGGLDVGLGEMQAVDEDAFVAALDADLAGRWSHRYGGPGRQRATAVAASGGTFFLAGTFLGGLDLGNHQLEGSPTAQRIFVAAVSP